MVCTGRGTTIDLPWILSRVKRIIRQDHLGWSHAYSSTVVTCVQLPPHEYISSQKFILTWAGIELLLVSDIPPKGLYKGVVTLPDLLM